MNPLDTLKHLPDEAKTLITNLISNAKLEAQIAVLGLVMAAEQAGAQAAHQFLEDKIDELKGQIKPL